MATGADATGAEDTAGAGLSFLLGSRVMRDIRSAANMSCLRIRRIIAGAAAPAVTLIATAEWAVVGATTNSNVTAAAAPTIARPKIPSANSERAGTCENC